MYDVIIIGGGPAGLSAGMYAASQKLKTLVITKTMADCEPAGDFQADLRVNKKFLELHADKEVTVLEKNITSFSVETRQGQQFYAQAVVIASGCEQGRGNTVFERLTLKDASDKIFVDANLQTNVPGIFAAGDVAVTLAKGIPSAIIEGVKVALTLDKILRNRYN